MFKMSKISKISKRQRRNRIHQQNHKNKKSFKNQNRNRKLTRKLSFGSMKDELSLESIQDKISQLQEYPKNFENCDLEKYLKNSNQGSDADFNLKSLFLDQYA